MNPENNSKTEYAVIGTRPIRHDGYEKVTGRAMFGADVSVPGLVWGEVLRSPHTHARIIHIDTSKAEQAPGVFSVVTRADFPSLASIEKSHGSAAVGINRLSNNLLAKDRVLYRGHGIAAVAAVDRNTATEATKLIDVVYEELPSVSNVDQAMRPDAPILHESLVGDHLGESVCSTNVAHHFRHEFGDLEQGFAESDLIIENTFTLQMVHQGYIEPHNATAIWDSDGRISVWSSNQGLFDVRDQTAAILGVPASSVTANSVEIGGGFGGKTKVYLAPIAAALSRKTGGKPVKMIMNRDAVFQSTGPAPGGKITVKIGVGNDGKIKASEADIRYEAGAFPGSAIDGGAAGIYASYNIPNTRIDGRDVVVNKPMSNAYRAPGIPQAYFAIEQMIDEICDQKGWDKIQFRLDNASSEGTRRGDGVMFVKIGLIETLEATRASDHWNSPLGTPAPGKLRGRGIASGFCMNGTDVSSVDLMLRDDGTVALNTGSVDVGGTRTAIAMQAAEVLCVSAENVHPTTPGTDGIGFTNGSYGSRTTYTTGFAAINAANRLIDEMKVRAAIIWDIEPDDIVFDSGVFTSSSDSGLTIGFKQLASRIDETGGPVSSTSSASPETAGPAFSVNICDLEIDPETGKTNVIRYTAIQDVGKAVHPAYVEGQMQGGTSQGIGWALNEEYFIDDDGAMANHTFLDYRMPVSLDLPMIETIIVEVPNPAHPFGVRGVGEVPITAPLPAVANAIKNATGKRLFDQPLKPGRILESLS